MEFQGLPKALISFLMEIRLNNNVSFFEANRKRYEQEVKQPLYALANALAPIVQAFDPLLDTRPLRCVSRIRRDTRFTRDKSPYRDHMWIGWRRLGEARMAGVSFYWEVSPEAVGWGCGVYSDRQALMEQMRGDMLARPKVYRKMLQGLSLDRRFTLHGNQYKRLQIPEALDPALAGLYRSKGFYVRNVPQPGDYDLIFSHAIVDRLAEDYAQLAPMYRLLREQEALACR